MIKEDAKLAACGCGGRAYIEEMIDGKCAERRKIRCSRCGMTLDHTQDFAYSNAGRVAINPSAIEVWNNCHKSKYDEGLTDAWKLMKKIIKMYSENSKGIFGNYAHPVNKLSKNLLINVMINFTPQEALAKLEAHEQEEIKVGDVVATPKNPKEYIVVNVKTGASISTDLRETALLELSLWEKTGKHIDLSGILAEIGKE